MKTKRAPQALTDDSGSRTANSAVGRRCKAREKPSGILQRQRPEKGIRRGPRLEPKDRRELLLLLTRMKADIDLLISTRPLYPFDRHHQLLLRELHTERVSLDRAWNGMIERLLRPNPLHPHSGRRSGQESEQFQEVVSSLFASLRKLE